MLLVDDRCNFRVSPDGHRTTLDAGKHYAEVNVTPRGAAIGFWNRGIGRRDRLTSLGLVTRFDSSGAYCYHNRRFEMCASDYLTCKCGPTNSMAACPPMPTDRVRSHVTASDRGTNAGLAALIHLFVVVCVNEVALGTDGFPLVYSTSMGRMAASPLISISLGHTSSAQVSASSSDINPVLKRYAQRCCSPALLERIPVT